MSKKSSKSPHPYDIFTDVGNAIFQGYKDAGYGVPSEGLFNPYDYINPDDYGYGRKGQAQYANDLAQLQYLAQLRQQEFQNEYNSPANQASLMREAGLNPDLLGLSGGTSSGITDPNINAMSGIPNNLQQASQVMSIVQSTLSLTGSLMSGVLGVFSGLSNMDAQNLNIASGALSFAENLLGLTNNPSGSDVVLGENNIDAVTTSASYRFLNKRNQSRIRQLSGMIKDSPRISGQWWKDASESESNRQSFAQLKSSPYYNDDFDELISAFRPLAKASAEAMIQGLKSRYSQDKYNEDYYISADNSDLAEISVGADFASRSLARDQDTMMSSLKKPLQDLIKNLDEKAKEGKNWANLALISLYTAMSATIQRSSGQSINGDTGELFQNSSWNFGF